MESLGGEWWVKAKEAQALLLRTLQDLLVSMQTGQGITESQSAAWRVVKDLSDPDKMLTSHDVGADPDPIVVNTLGCAPNHLLLFWIADRLSREEGGQLESVEATASEIAKAFARLVEILLNHGILNAQDLAKTMNTCETPRLERITPDVR